VNYKHSAEAPLARQWRVLGGCQPSSGTPAANLFGSSPPGNDGGDA
jgi:hypothetical protein